jgi:Xaa-Pro aminopeptidase
VSRAGRAARIERVRARMEEVGVEALLLSNGADMPWLVGYEATPLERPTVLVLPADCPPTLVVPELEAPRVELIDTDEGLFSLRPWSETEDPLSLVADLVGQRRALAVSDRARASVLLGLQERLPGATWRPASTVTGALRAVKDADEIDALQEAAEAADRVASALVRGEISLAGRTEEEVSADIAARLRAEGHARVNFAIVGSGPNSASPHHEPGKRVIRAGDAVVCDFGGTHATGYCSDITRTVAVGEPPPGLEEAYGVLEEAQRRAVEAAVVGATLESVDRAARDPISDGGYGGFFIHRTGHGIGLEAHEGPYVVAGNREQLQAGNAFSVEPGIYVPRRFGARIEDIVVATPGGPRSLNNVDRGLAVLPA